jgi:hypothetical protein
MPTVRWHVSWWTIIVEAVDPLDPIDWKAPLCASWLARNSGSCRSSITIARQFPTPAAVRSKASPNRSYAQRMLASFERLRVGNALILTKETLRSGHRLQHKYVLGTSASDFLRNAVTRACRRRSFITCCPCDRAVYVQARTGVYTRLTAPRQFDILQSGLAGGMECNSIN